MLYKILSSLTFKMFVIPHSYFQIFQGCFSSFQIQATEAVDKWKWLLYDEETFDEALVLANTLIRRFLCK